jgi:hypothetical protein
MASNFDEFITQFQQQVYEETKETYGVNAFQRWLEPKFLGQMPEASCSARLTGHCGETMEICLRIERERLPRPVFSWMSGETLQAALHNHLAGLLPQDGRSS